LPALAAAQSPAKTQTPVAPKTEQFDPKACTNSNTRSTVGQGGAARDQKPAKPASAKSSPVPTA